MVPGGNPIALAEPEKWSIDRGTCNRCGSVYCDLCIAMSEQCRKCGSPLTIFRFQRTGFFGTAATPEPRNGERLPISADDILVIGGGEAGKSTLVEGLHRCITSEGLTFPGAFRECAQHDVTEAAGALLVESIVDFGCSAHLTAKLLAAKGVPVLAAFINKTDMICDDDGVIGGLLELEIRDALTAAGFPGDELTVFFGSALDMCDNGTRSRSWVDLKQVLSPFVSVSGGTRSGDATRRTVGDETVATEQATQETQTE